LVNYGVKTHRRQTVAAKKKPEWLDYFLGDLSHIRVPAILRVGGGNPVFEQTNVLATSARDALSKTNNPHT